MLTIDITCNYCGRDMDIQDDDNDNKTIMLHDHSEPYTLRIRVGND